jgi:hypothetical protein
MFVTERKLPSFIQSSAHVEIIFAFRRFVSDNFHDIALPQAVQPGFRKRGAVVPGPDSGTVSRKLVLFPTSLTSMTLQLFPSPFGAFTIRSHKNAPISFVLSLSV